MGIDISCLMASRPPRQGRRGWAFPPRVRKLLIEETEGMSVLHMFGGLSDFGVRMDIDPATRPDVVADAWLPPFGRDTFDAVIMDPPYVGGFAAMNQSKVRDIFRAAAWVARRRVYWLHTLWVDHPARCRCDRAWLLVVGRSATVRCLQRFIVPNSERKLPPVERFARGEAIRYNHWLLPNSLLQLDGVSHEHKSPSPSV